MPITQLSILEKMEQAVYWTLVQYRGERERGMSR